MGFVAVPTKSYVRAIRSLVLVMREIFVASFQNSDVFVSLLVSFLLLLIKSPRSFKEIDFI